jgi:hypothetical protein
LRLFLNNRGIFFLWRLSFWDNFSNLFGFQLLLLGWFLFNKR